MIRKWIYKLRYVLIIGSALLGLLGASGSFGYDITTNCFCTNTSNCNNTYVSCFDFALNEEATFGADTSTVNGTFNFSSNGEDYVFRRYYRFQGSDTFDNYFYDFFNENGYINTLHSAYKNNSPISSLFYSGSRYCLLDYTSNNDFQKCGDISFSNFSGSVEDTIDFVGNNKLLSWRILNADNTDIIKYKVGLCGIFENNKAVCFILFGSNLNGYATNCSASNCRYPGTKVVAGNGINKDNIDISYLETYYGLSPNKFLFSAGGGGGGGLITGTGSMTNYEALMGYGYSYGFTDNYCYGGYSLDDIFVPDSNPDNFTGFVWGSGASIFDLFNAYSGDLNFTSISDMLVSFYGRYKINNLPSFWNYSKSLFSVVQNYDRIYNIYQTYDPNIGLSKLVEYCDLYINSDWDAPYTRGDVSAIDGYSNMLGEITDKWRYYESGPLSLLSGEDQKLDSDKFFTFLSDSVINGFGDLSNKSSGIIPNYIIAVLLALVLFRMFSH